MPSTPVIHLIITHGLGPAAIRSPSVECGLGLRPRMYVGSVSHSAAADATKCYAYNAEGVLIS